MDPTVTLLVVVVVAVAAFSAILAWRNRLPFRIAIRNIRRNRRRTVLLLLGLMVGTTIISGSLAVGDTDNQLNLHYTYLAIGYTDEAVYQSLPGTAGYAYFPYAVFPALATAAHGNPQIAGVSPEIVDTVSVLDRRTGVPQTNLNLIGGDANQTTTLGAFVTTAGASIAGPAPGEVLLDAPAAAEINASVGDAVSLYGVHEVTARILAIVQDNLRGAFLTGGLGNGGNVFVDLATAQNLTNQSGRLNFLAVTNVGTQASGVAASASVGDALNRSLARIPGASGLTSHSWLENSLASAASAGSSVTTIFLVLGLFSIVAGALLIVGLFVMLAEERKGEMGLLRAVGMRRGDLVRMFYFEGLVYSAGAAFVGTLLGILTGYLLVYAFSLFLGGQGLTQAAILASFNVTQRSLVIAYVAGFLLTLGTVAIASRRASRLNIVRAIRDIPEPPPPRRVYTLLAVVGGVVAVLGVLLFLATYRGTSDISEPLLGGTMAILGLSLVASRFVLNRIAFSAAGVAFLVWAGFEPLHTDLLGSAHAGGIFVIFVEGVTMVVGALLLYVFNASTVVGALLRAFGGRRRRSPAAHIGLNYPSRQATRTTINLSIFALVIFTMVAIATFGSTIEANVQNTIQTESGGYTFYGFSPLPIPDLPGAIAANRTLAGLFSATVPLVAGPVLVGASSFGPTPYGDELYAGPTGLNATSSFYTTSQFPMSLTWHGLAPAAVLQELATNRSVAVVDHSYAPPTTNAVSGGGPSGPPHPTVVPGTTIEIANPLTGDRTNVTVIAILTESILTGIWVNPAAAASLGYGAPSVYLLTLRSGVGDVYAEQQAKIAFFRYGLVLFDIPALLSSSIATTEGFVGLLQIFVGLGLVVGIAGMGIVALRAVVERRREIGMLRATGFTRRMVLRAFLIEYSFVALLGIAIGTALGVLIVFNLSQSPSAAASGVSFFSVPVTNLEIILSAAYALALLAVAGPSLRAARMPPADAVRSTE